jgi:phosphohistidine phosphatase SixA
MNSRTKSIILYIITLSLFFSGFAFSIETNPDKALKALKEGGKIVLIRHAFAPGIEGNIDKKGKDYIQNDCSTQRNLLQEGKEQSARMGEFFSANDIKIEKVLSSPVCRCWETAKYAGWKFKIDRGLTGDKKKFKKKIIKLSSKYKGVDNLILVTHGTLMRAIFPSYKIDQGGMIVADKDLNFIGSIEIPYEFTY